MGKETKLINFEKSAQFLKDNAACGLALIDRKKEDSFNKALEMNHLRVKELGRIHGLNYSTGKKLDLGLYKVVP